MNERERTELPHVLGAESSLAAARRFVAGFRLRILRPQDHLVLDVSGVGLTTKDDAGIPKLVAAGSGKARLIIGLPPQHTAEQVYQEKVGKPMAAALGVNEGDAEPVRLPTGARFAGPSRLVFDVGANEEIELTVAGILEAMARLPMVVVPLATPRQIWYPWLTATEVGAELEPILTMGVSANAVAAAANGATGAGGSHSRGIDEAMKRQRATRILAASGLGSRVRQLDSETRRLIIDLPAEERAAAIAGLVRRPDVTDRVEFARWLRSPSPRPVAADETAIEIPSRLLLSPSVRGGWAHAVSVDDERGDGSGAVELWHSRLGVRNVADDGTVTVDEDDTNQRIVRGIWTRDVSTWGKEPPPPAGNVPFTMSTSPSDRYEIVGRSSGTGLPHWTSPNPVDVNRLAVTSLGAFLDVRATWPVSDTWSLLGWQHRATLGRDQYVKVVYNGYLFPFGHRASLVKETRRRVDPLLPESDDTAILWQRWFLILKERTRSYDGRSMPFTTVTLAPHTTPDLDYPSGFDPTEDDPSEPPFFWPTVDGEPFRFIVSGVDHDGEVHAFTAPLIWVKAPMNDGATASQIYDAYGLTKDAQGFKHLSSATGPVELDLGEQRVAMAPSAPSGEAAYEARTFRFAADPGQMTVANPTLLFGDLIVPAVAAATGRRSPVRLAYATPYLNDAFDPVANAGEVVLQTARDAVAQSFSFAGSTDRAGGFLDPGQKIDGLSRRLGPVADIATSAAGGDVDPAALFAGIGKLFGLFDLADILAPLGLDKVPAYASRILDLAAALDGDLTRIPGMLPDAPAAVSQVKAKLVAATTAFDSLMATPPLTPAAAEAAFQDLIDNELLPAISGALQDQVLDQLALAQRAIVARTLGIIRQLVDPAELPPGLPPPAQTLARLARGEPVASLLSSVHLEWRPPLVEWPAGAPIFKPELNGKDGVLLLAVDVRGGNLVKEPSAQVLAQLTDFSLELVPGAPLLSIGFQRLLFKSSTGAKTDVDVVVDDLTWKGILAFVETLKDLIPLDGFSDPPSLTVDSTGAAAGFSVALPNVAVGVFNLSNLSLAADLKLPFVGDAPTVGFSFCSRERPFTLAVMIFGGGGFFGLRLNPKGVVLLEAALEFGAVAALDFVVASGSVSCMAGVYFRLEMDKGSLTGYLRIRGEVDVLGLISASIELYMSLAYEFGSGKVVGRATITVEVEILFFSASVKIAAERKFAGSAGDPTFADAMGPYADDGPWAIYCQAFAGS